MKTIALSISLIFLSSLTEAAEGFRCIPSMRSTRLQVLVQEKNIEVLVTNPMGYKFMPQFDGSRTMFDLSFNKMQADDLAELGDQFVLTWPKEACKVESQNFKVSCNGPAQNTIKSIKSYGISTTEVIEKYDADIYQKRKFRFSLEKDNMYFVGLEFLTQNCETF